MFVFGTLGEDGPLQPLHYRDLGEKDGEMYSKEVRWVDVAINGVPLEKTFEYENDISELRESFVSDDETNHIMVNDRKDDHNHHIRVEDDDDYEVFKKKWINRLEKIVSDPINLPSAKKKKKSKERYPVKPKRERDMIQSEEYSDKFNELVDKKEHGILGENVFEVWSRWKGADREESWCGPIKKTFCPPEHWLIPEIKWDRIWSEIDTIDNGYRRNYHYVEPGETDKDGVIGPAIYFYDENSQDLNYGFNYDRDFIQVGSHLNNIFPWGVSDVTSLSDTSTFERARRDYIENPNEFSYGNYMSSWRRIYGCSAYWRYSWISGFSYQDQAPPSPHL